jgi:hypothetical protein
MIWYDARPIDDGAIGGAAIFVRTMTPTTKSLLLTACLAATLDAQTSRWHRLDAYRGIADSLTMHWPSLAMAHDTMIVAANIFPSDAQMPTGKRRLAILRTPGRPLPLPAGDFSFAHPQLVIGARGALHLLWVEPNHSADTLSAWSSPGASLWHSSYRNGAWSKPRQLLGGRFLIWASEGRAVVSDGAGRVHIVVPAALDDGQLAIVYLRLGDDGTVENEIRWPGGSQASLTSLRHDSVLVAYSTADSLTQRRGSTVLVRISGDRGGTWSAPLAVTRSDRRNVSPPIVEQSGSELHALWIEQTATNNPPAVVRGFISRSPFDRWSEVEPPSPTRGVPLRFLSAGTQCGGYAALVEFIENPMSDARMRIAEVFIRDKHFIASDVFPQLETAASVGLAPKGDSLRIVLSVVRPREKTAVNATAIGRACGTT